ncbi:hypothetical protein [Actinomadura sp. KC06]|uniref:hypothetical protein n=1 Tax=Actinomadura sp. KC06 TaxID=2530369 RepID=UPI001404E399|nr:hypothetical protein [Actinomadura sp. KC06]
MIGVDMVEVRVNENSFWGRLLVASRVVAPAGVGRTSWTFGRAGAPRTARMAGAVATRLQSSLKLNILSMMIICQDVTAVPVAIFRTTVTRPTFLESDR